MLLSHEAGCRNVTLPRSLRSFRTPKNRNISFFGQVSLPSASQQRGISWNIIGVRNTRVMPRMAHHEGAVYMKPFWLAGGEHTLLLEWRFIIDNILASVFIPPINCPSGMRYLCRNIGDWELGCSGASEGMGFRINSYSRL